MLSPENHEDKKQEFVDKITAEINREFTGGSGNVWISCFITQLTILNPEIYFDDEESEEKTRLQAKFNELNDSIARFKQPNVEVPEEDKQRFIEELANICSELEAITDEVLFEE